MLDHRSIRIPLVTAGPAGFWLAALLLLCIATFGPTDNFLYAGLWSIFLLSVAVAWTVIAALCLNRRKVVDGVANRIKLMQETDRLARI